MSDFFHRLLTPTPDPLKALFAREHAREQADALAAENQRIDHENTTREFIRKLTNTTTEEN